MRTELSSWGRLSRHPHETVVLYERDRAGSQIRESALPGIAHAAGRSYGDICLNGEHTAWLTRGLDKFIAFDADTGVLRCEAGVTLQQISALSMPHGWFLPVTPGTQFATVGGAVANDVHGKNHHQRGSFGEHITELGLLRTDGCAIRCGPLEHSEWFCATVGGMGLTGLIADVSVQLRRVNGPWVDTQTETFDTLEEFYALSAKHVTTWEYSVAWIDCGRSARGTTRGAFFCGNHADRSDALVPARTRSAALLPALRWVNPLSAKLFNAAYFRRQRAIAGRATQPYTAFFYPLDGLLEWNRIYGHAGFYQYQCVIPRAVQLDATHALLREIQASDSGSFLSVLKTFGDRASPGMLSFPMAGTTLALDFPNRGDATLRLFDRLNAIVSAAGGRLYPAKDAAMPAALFQSSYPRLEEFKAFRDPGMSSEMSRRLLGL